MTVELNLDAAKWEKLRPIVKWLQEMDLVESYQIASDAKVVAKEEQTDDKQATQQQTKQKATDLDRLKKIVVQVNQVPAEEYLNEKKRFTIPGVFSNYKGFKE